jgi:hypothetical protein
MDATERYELRRREFIMALCVGALLAKEAVATTNVQRVAFFGFELINTSAESTTPDEVRRIRMLNENFSHELSISGRFEMVPIPDEMRDRIAAGTGIANCNGCQRDYAKKLDADLAAWGTVQKVSNLILNINLYVEDEHSEKLKFVKSVDIRGNTDESWRRGLTYILQNYFFRSL